MTGLLEGDSTKGYSSSIHRPTAGMIGGVGLGTAAPERKLKVVVCGASGGIGQTLSLFLKINLPEGSTLRMYDVAPSVRGVAADVSHVDTQVQVEHYVGDPKVRGCPQLQAACRDADVVSIIAGFPRQPGMTRADLFDRNASIVRNLVEVIAHVCPFAVVCIGTNPVNSLIPLAADILKAKGVYNKDKLFGVTLLDNMRACAFINDYLQSSGRGWEDTLHPPVKDMPVVGGHSETTIVPLYSLVLSGQKIDTDKDLDKLYTRVRKAGTEVVEAKAGKGSATLSMGVANAYFVTAICDALLGRRRPTICAMVDMSGQKEVPYLAWPVRLGMHGIEGRLSLPKINATEERMLGEAIQTLRKDIDVGTRWANSQRETLWKPAKL